MRQVESTFLPDSISYVIRNPLRWTQGSVQRQIFPNPRIGRPDLSLMERKGWAIPSGQYVQTKAVCERGGRTKIQSAPRMGRSADPFTSLFALSCPLQLSRESKEWRSERER